jgi:hypothetical protein
VDAHEIINDRQAEDARVRVERNHNRRLEAQNEDAQKAG